MSAIQVNRWQNPDGTENYKCRAWVNFNGTGTVAIRASGNVSSITDNGVGDYTVNLTTAMPDANYAALVTGGIPNGNTVSVNESITTARTALLFRMFAIQAAATDLSVLNVAFFR